MLLQCAHVKKKHLCPTRQTGTATVTATYSYDALNRLTQESFSDGSTPTVKYGYDGVALTGCTVAPPSLSDANPIGRRTAMCDGAGAESWSHDSLGRPLTDQRTTNGVTKSIPYTYNLDGSIASITYRQDYYPETLSYTPGGAGRPIAAPFSDGWGLAYAVHYAPNGSLCSLYSGWGQVFEHNYTFNNRLQVTAIQDWDESWYVSLYGSDPAPCTTTASAPPDALDLTYSYTDAAGHNNGSVLSIYNNLDMERTQLFTYDSLNRLATAETLHQNQPWWQGDSPTAECWGEQFNYDAWGNLSGISPVSSAYTGCTQENWSMTATTKNQLQDTNNDYVYDAAGNLIQPGPIGGPYVFDAENHLISAGGMAYLYDGDGKRVGKAPASTPTQPNYLYWYGIGSDILEETDGAGNYLYRDFRFNGMLLARGEDDWVDHFFADALGNTRCVYGDNDPDGGCSDYYPFGGERPIASSNNGVNVPFKFTGKERDSESGLDNFGARYNSSNFGRFMSPDDSSGPDNEQDPQGLNLYSYVQNNPMNAVDPDGRDCFYIQESAAYVIRGDCSAAPGGATAVTYVPGTINEKSGTYDPKTGTLSFAYTAYPGGPSGIAQEVIGGIFPEGGVNDAGRLNANAVAIFSDINRRNIIGNTFKIYGAGAVIGATGGTACYLFCGSLGVGTITTLGATAGGTLGPAATDPRLQNFINMLFQATDQMPGGTAGAVRYEIRTGELLSDAGHSIKAQEVINGLQKLVNNGTLSQADTATAKALIEDLRSALSTSPWMR